MQKSLRIQTAKDTLQEIKQGFYINPITQNRVEIADDAFVSQHNTIFWETDKLQALLDKFSQNNKYSTTFEVTNCSTIDAIIQLSKDNTEKIGILNFASAKNPGGGVLSGASAQEESLARSSGLYDCLLKAPKYYQIHKAESFEANGEMHKKTALYTDNMIYSPKVPFFKNDKGEYFDMPICVDVVTSPAVNAGVVQRQENRKNIDVIDATLLLRMEKMLALFAKNECMDLVLGAWGCGVFQNKPKDIANLFSQCLKGKFKNTFRKIIFAIYDKDDNVLLPFRNHF
jgi:uncharacterized protein (TIGR02452 family)